MDGRDFLAISVSVLVIVVTLGIIEMRRALWEIVWELRRIREESPTPAEKNAEYDRLFAMSQMVDRQ